MTSLLTFSHRVSDSSGESDFQSLVLILLIIDTLFKSKLFLVCFILFMILAKPHGHQLQITASLRREGKGGRCRRFAERPLRCKFSDDTVLLHN